MRKTIMLRNTFIIIFASCLIWICPQITFSQEPSATPVNARKSKRITGVKIQGGENVADKKEGDSGGKSKRVLVALNKQSSEAEIKRQETERLEAERVERMRQAQIQLENDAAEKSRLEAENIRLETERKDREKEFAESQRIAEEEKQKVIRQAEEDKQKLIQESEANAKKQQEAIDAARIESERVARENADLQAKADAAKKLAEETEKNRVAAEAARVEAGRIRAEVERVAREQREKEKAEMEVNRVKMVEMTAQKLGFVDTAEAVKLVPVSVIAASDIEKVLGKAILDNPRLSKETSFCDVPFNGAPLNLELTADDTFGTLLDDLRLTFGVNFLPDAEILDLPVRVNVQGVPWNVVLCQQLSNLDIEARYVGKNVISLVRRSKLLTLQDSRRKTAPTKTEYIKLKYLRPVINGQTNLAGKSTGTANVESLEQAIQKILSNGGDSRGSISRIPGRAEFFITATDAQFDQIRQVIAKADRPTYRVDVFGLVYTVNENKLKDVGSQLSAIINTGGRSSGFTTLPQPTQAPTGSTTGATTNAGVGGLGVPFGNPNGLAAGSPNTILGARVRLGLVEFNYQLSLLEQLGVARRVEKPFVSAKDGSTATFENGTQIPVIIQAVTNLGGGGGSIDFINAGTTLSATPQVIEDENGNPKLVNLSLRLESNTPDLSIQTSGNVPSVNSRRVQNEITIAPGVAFIFGGSNDIGDSNTVSRTPVLGELPGIGNLFKRKTKQRTDNKLYFAVWVQISLDDGNSPIETDTLNTTFPKPPAMDAPLVLPSKKP